MIVEKIRQSPTKCLLISHPRMDRAEKFWDKLADTFDRRVLKHCGQYYIWTVENTIQYLNRSDVVLDYACGTGIIAIEIAQNVKEIYAIDISLKMIEVAKIKTYERKIENIHFVHSTIFDERYKRGTFDVILAFNILHLIEDTQKLMQRIYELLKPGGLFISATECTGDKKTFFNVILLLVSGMGIVPYLKSFNISELEGSITKGNFQIIERDSLKNTQFIVGKKIQRI